MPDDRPGAPPGAPPGDARALESALSAAGLDARVRADGAMALLAAAPDAFAAAGARALAARLARAHGFTHVALVLPDAPPSDDEAAPRTPAPAAR